MSAPPSTTSIPRQLRSPSRRTAPKFSAHRTRYESLEETHWAIHQAHCDYQWVAEDRRHLAAATGETIRAFVDELVAAGWSEHEARNASVHDLASH